ncbi:MAG: hypothetical protein HWD58_09995 [Bacteroidota bacterium]|nr:MAG: hypothetical protein HWD58_09995 [Bacteroidota bacterium]
MKIGLHTIHEMAFIEILNYEGKTLFASYLNNPGSLQIPIREKGNINYAFVKRIA